MERDISTFVRLDEFVEELASSIRIPALILLKGDLGVGKTTLTAKLAEKLGIEQKIVSPTYFFMREYEMPSGKRFLHVDMYRLKDQKGKVNLENLMHEIDSNDGIIVVEWPFGEFEKGFAKLKQIITLNMSFDGDRRLVELI